MSKIFVPQSLLDELVCLKCKNLLSVFPIYTRYDQVGAICGRCGTEFQEDEFIHDTAYEGFVKSLLFPCMYQKNGCSESLTPELLKKHELECDYNKFDCVDEKCQWQGPKDKILQHFEEDHADMVLNQPNFKFNANSHFEQVMLLEHNSEVFQADVKFDDQKMVLHFFVKPLLVQNKSVRHLYNLKLMSGQETHYTKEYATAEKARYKQEELSKVFDKHGEITVHIRIKHPFNNNNEDSPNSNSLNENLDWHMLSELECPVCYDHMVPPIYQCLGGHSVCQACKPKLTTCPTCRKRLEYTRNFVLEKISQKLNYPCKYYKQGCSFYALSGEISTHEKDCIRGPLTCPVVQCAWNGNACDFESHLQNTHSENILKTDRVEYPVLDVGQRMKFVLFSNRIFVIFYKNVESSFYCAVHSVGLQQNTERYKYEIDIVDLSGNNMRCCWSSIVKTGTPLNLNDYLCFAHQQIRSFVSDMIVFKVKVSKI